MTLKEKVNKDFIQARKDKDTLKADLLRLIKTEYDSFLIDNKREMTEAEEIHVFLKDIKKNNEAIAGVVMFGVPDGARLADDGIEEQRRNPPVFYQQTTRLPSSR